MSVRHVSHADVRAVLRSCARGDSEYSRTADTSGRPPGVCAYCLSSTVEVHVRELGVGDGGLGWRVWVGALALAEWMVAHATLFDGASVLELGAGLGLPGLVAAQLGAHEVALTDCLPALVANCEHNIALNRERHRSSARVRALAMDWQTAAADSALAARLAARGRLSMEDVVRNRAPFPPSTPWLGTEDTFRIVLASEVLYEEEHAPTLAAALATHLERSDGARAAVMYVTRDRSFLCSDGILFAFVREASARGLYVRITAGRQGGLSPFNVEFAARLSPKEAEGVRSASLHAAPDWAACVRISLLSLRWGELGGSAATSAGNGA